MCVFIIVILLHLALVLTQAMSIAAEFRDRIHEYQAAEVGPFLLTADTSRQILQQGTEDGTGIEDLVLLNIWRAPDLTSDVPVQPGDTVLVP